jgi:hypothetical protein
VIEQSCNHLFLFLVKIYFIYFLLKAIFFILSITKEVGWAWDSTAVEALCYKLEGCGLQIQ